MRDAGTTRIIAKAVPVPGASLSDFDQLIASGPATWGLHPRKIVSGIAAMGAAYDLRAHLPVGLLVAGLVGSAGSGGVVLRQRAFDRAPAVGKAVILPQGQSAGVDLLRRLAIARAWRSKTRVNSSFRPTKSSPHFRVSGSVQVVLHRVGPVQAVLFQLAARPAAAACGSAPSIRSATATAAPLRSR